MALGWKLNTSANVLTCKVLVSPSRDKTVFIFKLSLTTTDLPFKFEQVQFPIKHAYAVKIHII